MDQTERRNTKKVKKKERKKYPYRSRLQSDELKKKGLYTYDNK